MAPNEHDIGTIGKEADALEDAGLLPEALSKWREAVAQGATPVTLARLGRAAAQLKQWHEAEQAFLAAIAAAPQWGLPCEALAVLYTDQGDLGKAEDCLRRSLLHGTKRARTLTLLGDVLERDGRDSEARAVLQEAIAIDPSYEEAYLVLGLATKDEDPREAISHYQHAIALDPNYVAAHRELGWTLRRLNRLDEAEQHLRQALELQGTDPWAFVYLGNILWRKSDIEGAADAFENAIRADPKDSTAYWCLADLRREQGRLREARALLKESLRLGIDDVQANLRFGLLLRDQGQARKARRYFERVLRFDPENTTARRLLQ